ncbi:Uncharacterised protein [Serratia grimesii]|uniref:hypothetical protein n=1 Tax=Serratia grimesii TaxID=82995 RepID=UPI00076F3E8C|nr:hypothetical protein [Serratia grimesii]CUW11583.1 Uncharacterised protein [Serratia grimesii]SMZ56163.1 Uncharacterised protein [Serratia grimesii]
MQAAETHYLDNGFTFNIPPAPYRRRICVPLLMAIAPGGKSEAKHMLVYKGAWVTEAKAVGGRVLAAGTFVPVPGSACNSWNTYIEPNQSVSIQAVGESSDGAYVLPSITVLIGQD